LKSQAPASASAAPRLTRRVLDTLPMRTLHAARNWSKADVYLSEWPPQSGHKVVVKDFKKRALWFRIVAGRYFLRREWQALRVLDGTRGVPRAIAKPDADSLVVEYVRGEPLSEIPRRTISDATMDRLETLVRTLHERGVTHGDLHLENILVDEDGQCGYARLGHSARLQQSQQNAAVVVRRMAGARPARCSKSKVVPRAPPRY
jgi:tRNA A-37 threonylcarbamoyl transferase component Bud32